MSRRIYRAAPWYRKYVLAVAGGLLFCIGVLCMGALAASLVDLPGWGMNGILLVGTGGGAYLTGLLAGRRCRRHGLSNGAVLGAVLGISILGISALCRGHLPCLHALVRVAWTAVLGSVGCVQGVNQKQPGVPEG